MGRVKQLFVCSGCGRPSAQWTGRCSSCGEWGSVSEHPAGTGASSAHAAGPSQDLAAVADERRISTGFAGVDRVLGGGLVAGSVVLLAGAPGIGKSTLLLQLASRLSAAGYPCLIASGEESRSQIASRARRLGLDGEALAYHPGRDLDEVIAVAVRDRPAVLAVDSIHTIRSAGSDALAGGPGQVRLCVDALTGLAKEHGITTILVGHVTKAGDLAGPRTIEHAVDVVLQLRGRLPLRPSPPVRREEPLRLGGRGGLVRDGRGGLDETDGGPMAGGRVASPAARPPSLSPAGGPSRSRSRPWSSPPAVRPRRHVDGLNARRFDIVAAVTDRAARVGLLRADLYGSVAGGYRLEDPGADLAVSVALASAATGRPAGPATAFVGEVSLTGAVRPVGGMEQRASAAAAVRHPDPRLRRLGARSRAPGRAASPQWESGTYGTRSQPSWAVETAAPAPAGTPDMAADQHF